MIDGGELDEYLDRILRAAGSGLRNYTMQKSLDDMRVAIRAIYDRGREDGEIAMMSAVLKQDEAQAREVQRRLGRHSGDDDRC